MVITCNLHWCFLLYANVSINWSAQARMGVHCNLHCVVVFVSVFLFFSTEPFSNQIMFWSKGIHLFRCLHVEIDLSDQRQPDIFSQM